mmetsp:Transcript_464/g.1172  ORF Transcript_464/g.1172 Transcript_464/m.1172 type:complete len:262 (-) Transcript_464:373-1158(-)
MSSTRSDSPPRFCTHACKSGASHSNGSMDLLNRFSHGKASSRHCRIIAALSFALSSRCFRSSSSASSWATRCLNSISCRYASSFSCVPALIFQQRSANLVVILLASFLRPSGPARMRSLQNPALDSAGMSAISVMQLHTPTVTRASTWSWLRLPPVGARMAVVGGATTMLVAVLATEDDASPTRCRLASCVGMSSSSRSFADGRRRAIVGERATNISASATTFDISLHCTLECKLDILTADITVSTQPSSVSSCGEFVRPR